MTEQVVDQLVAEVKSKFDGRDPIAELGAFIQDATLEELRGMVLLSANKIGEALTVKGMYENPYQAALGVNLGADLLLTTYKFTACQNTSNIQTFNKCGNS